MRKISNCQKCSKPVHDRHQAVSCDSCGEWQHRGCDTGITKYQYQKMRKGGIELPFTCTVCKRNESLMETSEIGGISELHLALPVMEATRLSIAEEAILPTRQRTTQRSGNHHHPDTPHQREEAQENTAEGN